MILLCKKFILRRFSLYIQKIGVFFLQIFTQLSRLVASFGVFENATKDAIGWFDFCVGGSNGSIFEAVALFGSYKRVWRILMNFFSLTKSLNWNVQKKGRGDHEVNWPTIFPQVTRYIFDIGKFSTPKNQFLDSWMEFVVFWKALDSLCCTLLPFPWQ